MVVSTASLSSTFFGEELPIGSSSPSLVIRSLHTALCTKGGGKGGEDGDEDVEDFTPSGIVVESSHSVKCFFKG